MDGWTIGGVILIIILFIAILLPCCYMSWKWQQFQRTQCAVLQRRIPEQVNRSVCCYMEQNEDQLKGKRGLRGPKGCEGDRGLTGLTGATGPAGSPLPFAEFIANMPLDNPAAIPSGEAIEYPVDGEASAVSSSSIIRYSLDPTRTFLLPTIGQYRVDHEGTVESATLPGPSPVPSFDLISEYAVIAATTITNTGATTLHGSLALSPGTSVVGFPPGIVTGTQEVANAAALAAQGDLTAAAVFITALPPGTDLTGIDLAGLTVTPGTYDWAAAALQSGGVFTLDGAGTYYFRIGSTLTTLGGSVMAVINGAAPANVFWLVGSSATLGTGSLFYGNIIATASITATTGAVVQGTLGAMGGAVTLDTNQVFSRNEAIPAVSGIGTGGAQVVLSLASGLLAPFVQLTERTLIGINTPGQLKSSPIVRTTVANSLLRVINPISGTLPLVMTPFAGGTNPVTARILITQIR